MKMAKHTKYMSKCGPMNKKTKYMSKGGPVTDQQHMSKGGAVTDQQQMAMGNGSKKSKNKSKKGSVPGHNNLFA